MVTKIVVFGMGYVGIPAAALLADVKGFQVTGVQRRSKRSGWKIDYLNEGKNPIKGNEPGLEELIHRVVLEKKSFKATDSYDAVKDADYILVDVQTPTDEKHVPQYVSLKEVAATVGKLMKKGVTVIIESTCAPGTTNYIIKPILEENSGMKAGTDFHLAFSYERVMVGRLLHNITNYARIVGGLTPKCTEKGIWLYKHIVKAPLYPTDPLTAEVAKTVENAYRDVNIAFSNEVAIICESLGVDAYDVREFVNSLPNDPSNPSANPVRNMHFPGAGVGGHCLPKDTWLLKYGLDKYGRFKFEPKILVDSRNLNDHMPQHMEELLDEALKEKGIKMKDARVCILGYAFLEESDDTRNTPCKPLYNILKGKCREVAVHDPYVTDEEGIPLTSDLKAALDGKDAAVIVTSHKEYSILGLDGLKKLLRTKIIVDGRNVFDPEAAAKAGFTYRGVGRGLIYRK
ncbi:MAG: nucleotide sugar dehydrogenase [Candidatus Altiarchaeota archaeon]